VAAQEAGLQSGTLSATIAFSDGGRAFSDLTFDLGGPGNQALLHDIAGNPGVAGTRNERITVGGTTWARVGNGPWNHFPEQEGVWGQIQPFLPHAAQVQPGELLPGTDPSALRWTDLAASADVMLQTDPATHIPKRMWRLNRRNGSQLIVNYTGWNVPVKIQPPLP
jgi:hypothetical protein